MIEEIAVLGNLRLGRATGRRFPGLLIQGDTLASLLDELEEDAPGSGAHLTVRDLLGAYEVMMKQHDLELPYHRPQAPGGGGR